MRISIFLAAVTAIVAAAVGGAADENFEVPADEAPAASLAPAQISGDKFHVRDPVQSDGLMHHYVMESEFGEFRAYGRDALEVRLQEVAALTRIAKTSESDVVFKTVARGLKDDVKSVVGVARNPVKTVIGIPKGIGHLLGGYRARAEELSDKNKKSSKPEGKDSGSADSKPDKQNAAQSYAKRYLGLSATEREWYAKLGVDPYTRNEVLRHAVTRLAKVGAATKFAMKFAPVGVPYAGQARRATDAIYKEDPAVLRKRRHEALTSYGLTPDEVETFENTMLLDPTRQTELVDAVKTLEGVSGREELLRHAMSVTSEEEVEVFLRSTRLLLATHARRPIARIVAGLRVPSAQFADGRVAVFGAFDAVQWTVDVAGYERALREALPASTSGREVWLSGSISPRARDALTQLGWDVHDHASGAVDTPPASSQ